jgi:hypothetical protein
MHTIIILYNNFDYTITFMAQKTNKCPKCNGADFALIIWGVPVDKTISRLIESKKIVLDESLTDDDDSKWRCNLCYFRWSSDLL